MSIPRVLTAATAIAISIGTAQAQQAPLKMTLFGQPSVNNDSIWMAIDKGFYQQEGLDVTYRLFPSGTTAFQATSSLARNAGMVNPADLCAARRSRPASIPARLIPL